MVDRSTSGNHPMRIFAVAGSLREGSFNRALLRAATDLAPADIDIRIFDRLGEIPPYDADVDKQGDPEPVAALKEAIRAADGLLFVTPEYNYGVPGVLKNAVDWASRPPTDSVLDGKPAGIMGASPGMSGTIRSQLQLRQAFVFTKTLPLPAPDGVEQRLRRDAGVVEAAAAGLVALDHGGALPHSQAAVGQ